jgi:hypothetical protein
MIKYVIVVVENELETANARSIVQTLETVLLTETRENYRDAPNHENTIILFVHIIWNNNNEEYIFNVEKNEALNRVKRSLEDVEPIDVRYIPTTLSDVEYIKNNGPSVCASRIIETITRNITALDQTEQVNCVMLLDVLLSSEDNIDKTRLEKDSDVLSKSVYLQWTDENKICLPYTKYDDNSEDTRRKWQDAFGAKAPKLEQRGEVFQGAIHRKFKERLFSALQIVEA